MRKSHFPKASRTDCQFVKVNYRVASLLLDLTVRPCFIIIIKLYFLSLIIFSENKISLIKDRYKDSISLY